MSETGWETQKYPSFFLLSEQAAGQSCFSMKKTQQNGDGYGALLRAQNFLPSQMSCSRRQWWQRMPGPAQGPLWGRGVPVPCAGVPAHPAGLLVWGSCRQWSPSKNIIHILKTYGAPASPRGLSSCHCQAGLESLAAEMCWCPFPCGSSCKASTAGTL